MGGGDGGGGGYFVQRLPSDYFVSTQLQLLLFYCLGCGYCWAVTILSNSAVIVAQNQNHFSPLLITNYVIYIFQKRIAKII